jgi:hypothetical protein
VCVSACACVMCVSVCADGEPGAKKKSDVSVRENGGVA